MKTSSSSGTRAARQLAKEKALAVTFASLLSVSAFSGLVTDLVDLGVASRSLHYLMHAIFGLFLFVGSLFYAVYHQRRTVGVRRPLTVASGHLLAAILLLLGIGGTYIVLFGVTESSRWVLVWHRLLSYATLGLLILHVMVALLGKGKGGKRIRVLSASRPLMGAGATTLLYFAVVGVGGPYLDRRAEDGITKEIPADYQLPFGEQPFAPSQTVFRDNKVLLQQAAFSISRQCGGCHADIFRQWSSSAHSQAASDPSYVKNVDLLADTKGLPATRFCEGCHAPVALLGGQLTEGGRHGGTPGTAAFEEGVGCLGCHAIQRVAHLKGVAS